MVQLPFEEIIVKLDRYQRQKPANVGARPESVNSCLRWQARRGLHFTFMSTPLGIVLYSQLMGDIIGRS